VSRGVIGKRGLLPSVILLAVFLLASWAAAEQTRQRSISLARSRTAVLITTSYADLIDAGARQKIDEGLWNRVVVRTGTRRIGVERPVALAARTCRVRREIWEELYEVQIEDHSGRSTKRYTKSGEAIAKCTNLKRFPVVSLSALQSGRHQVEIIAELNPMSDELLESVRRLIRSPQGRNRSLGQGSNFFGSVVSIFVNNRIGEADRMVQFRSQEFSQ
jgi:hypothetical protein